MKIKNKYNLYLFQINLFFSIYHQTIILIIQKKMGCHCSDFSDVISPLPAQVCVSQADHLKFQQKDKEKQKQKRNLIIIIGGPGSGKSYICQKLVTLFGLHHISSGDLLREVVQNNDQHSSELRAIMKEGKMVSSELVIELIRKKISTYDDNKTVLLDGFPRNKQNIQKWNEMMSNELEFKNLLYFSCDQSALTKRLINRGIKNKREDDNEETIKKRLQVFEKSTLPIIKSFKSEFCLKVNAEQPKQILLQEVKQKLIKAGYKLNG